MSQQNLQLRFFYTAAQNDLKLAQKVWELEKGNRIFIYFSVFVWAEKQQQQQIKVHCDPHTFLCYNISPLFIYLIIMTNSHTLTPRFPRQSLNDWILNLMVETFEMT